MHPRLRPPLCALAVLACSLTLRAGSQTAPQPRDRAPGSLQAARELFAEGRYREAVDLFRQARAGAASSIAHEATSGLASALLRLGEFSEAFAEARDLSRAVPGSPSALALYGDALWAMGRFQDSERAMRDALALAPEHARARHGLGRALAARSRLADALEELKAAQRSDPADAEIHHSLGILHQRLARFESASAALGVYVRLLPPHERDRKAVSGRAHIRMLDAFAGREPLKIADEREIYTIPFRLAGDKVVVAARVNGRPIDLVLDTGAELTVLSERAARRAGVQPVALLPSAGVGELGVRGLPVGRIDTLQIGSLRVTDIPCVIKSPPGRGLPARRLDAFSPLALGLSVTIDYRSRLLSIGRDLPPLADALQLPLWFHRLPMVRGTLNGDHDANFVVDTGGAAVTISYATAGAVQPVPPPRKIPVRVYGTSGLDRDAFLMPGVPLAFDNLVLPNSALVVLNLEAPSALLGFRLDGTVGHRFLSRYTVSLDLQRSVLSLAR